MDRNYPLGAPWEQNTPGMLEIVTFITRIRTTRPTIASEVSYDPRRGAYLDRVIDHAAGGGADCTNAQILTVGDGHARSAP
jgi:hypothetical protein